MYMSNYIRMKIKDMRRFKDINWVFYFHLLGVLSGFAVSNSNLGLINSLNLKLKPNIF